MDEKKNVKAEIEKDEASEAELVDEKLEDVSGGRPPRPEKFEDVWIPVN